MKRIGLIFVGVVLVIAGLAVAGVGIGGASQSAGPPEGHKVTICHSVNGKGETGNGFNIIDVDKDSIANVEGSFNGHGLDLNDIIPAFPAGNDPGPPAKAWGSFPGRGDASWISNNCAAPSTSTTTTTTTDETTTTETTTTETTTTTPTTTDTTTTTTTTTPTTSTDTTTTGTTSTTPTTSTDSTTTTPPTTSTGGVPPASGVAGETGSSPPAAPTASSPPATGQTLPYTGAADWLPALAGGLMLVAGLGLRRLGRDA